MAVPASGALNMLNMAREALYGTWGSGTITGPISLYDMINSGNTKGSGNSYPAINEGCLPNPASRTSTTLTGVRDGMGGSAPRTLYYNSSIGAASNLTSGDQLYTNSSLTTAEGQTFNEQTGSSATSTICSQGSVIFFNTNTSGQYLGGTCQSL
jgi:hypothetical protein